MFSLLYTTFDSNSIRWHAALSAKNACTINFGRPLSLNNGEQTRFPRIRVPTVRHGSISNFLPTSVIHCHMK